MAVDSTTEPLEGVVVAVADLQVVDLRTATDRTEGDTVDLLVGLEGIAGKLDTDITECSGRVAIVVATVLRARATLNLLLGLVVLGTTAEDQSSPVARTTLTGRLSGREDDRCIGSTASIEFAATFYNQSRLALLFATDDGTGFNGQFGPLRDIDPTAQDIGALPEGLLAHEDKFIIAIADGVAKEEIVCGLEATILRPVAIGGLLGFILLATAHCQRHADCGGEGEK